MWEMDALSGLGRIERVARVSKVENDVENSFRRNNREEKEGSAFHRMLMQKISDNEKKEAAEVKISDPYLMDCTRATQSLFYRNGVTLNINIG